MRKRDIGIALSLVLVLLVFSISIPTLYAQSGGGGGGGGSASVNCIASAGYLCTNPIYNTTNGAIILKLSQNTGVDWGAAVVAYVPAGGQYLKAFSYMNINNESVIGQWLSGQTKTVVLTTGNSGTNINGSIWICWEPPNPISPVSIVENMSGGCVGSSEPIYYSQIATTQTTLTAQTTSIVTTVPIVTGPNLASCNGYYYSITQADQSAGSSCGWTGGLMNVSLYGGSFQYTNLTLTQQNTTTTPFTLTLLGISCQTQSGVYYVPIGNYRIFFATVSQSASNCGDATARILSATAPTTTVSTIPTTTLPTTTVPTTTIPYSTSNACIAGPGFLCTSEVLGPTGNLTFRFGQSTGSTFYNVGAACTANSTSTGLPNPTTAMIYLSGAGAATGINSEGGSTGFLTLSSGHTVNVSGLKCFNSVGLPLASAAPFAGSIWLNYTVAPGTPSASNPMYTAKIATIQAGATTATTTIPPFNYATYTLTLNAGWNLFSIPLEYATGLSGTCSSGELVSPVWQLSNGQYIRATSLYGGVGYWIKSTAACALTFAGPSLSINEFSNLNAGWNMIGALNGTTQFSSIKGTCNVVSGPFGFDIASNSYYNSTSLVTGSGYFINVTSACNLGSGAPPAPP